MSIFDVRKQFKPYEYPVAIDLMDALQKTYWLHTEVAFSADPQEINALPLHEQEAVIRALLSISTIEVAVKTFWTQLGNHFPKPEWEMLGVVAGESECRHARSYAHLLSLLNLEERFNIVNDVPCIANRFNYLDKYLKLSPGNSDKRKYVIKLILFSLLIEHVSLFSQFVTILYFYKQKGVIKDVRNIIKWTAVEESLHFNIGATIVSILRKEHPELFDEELNALVKSACIKSVRYESEILDWIFEKGELENLSKNDLTSYIKDKVNKSLVTMGFESIFDENDLDLTNTKFFNEEVFADSMDDFFASRPTDYTLKDISITAEDLF